MSDFLYLNAAGKQQGPIPAAELARLVRQGSLPGNTLVWTAGMSAWAPVSTLPGLLPPRATPVQVKPRPAPQGANKAFTWILLAVGGGVILLSGLTLLVVLVVIAMSGNPSSGPSSNPGGGPGGAGGNQKPAQLAGSWTGQLYPDFSNFPQLKGLADNPNPQQGIQFDFQCTADGKVKWGMGGIILPHELHAGLVKRELFVINPNAKAMLTEFATTTDSCRFIIYEAREQDFSSNGPGTDFVVTNARKSTITLNVRRVGEELQAECVVAQGGADATPAIPLKGRLKRG